MQAETAAGRKQKTAGIAMAAFAAVHRWAVSVLLDISPHQCFGDSTGSEGSVWGSDDEMD